MLDRTVAKIVVSLGLLGLFDAVYLTVKHYTGGTVPCRLTGGCDTVLHSSFATFAGLPLALWGVGYYLVLILLAALFITFNRRGLLALAFGLTTAGVFSYGILIYLQWQVLAAWCAYCLFSAGLTLVIFLSLLISRPSER